MSEVEPEATTAPEEDTTVAPLSSPWEVDVLQPYCADCACPFASFNRRHHCRMCGKIFCNDCSSDKCLIPPSSIVLIPHDLRYGKGLEERTKLAREPLRVCRACHVQLFPVQEELRVTSSNAMRYNAIDPTDPRRLFNSPLAFTLGHEVRKAAYTLNNLLPLPNRMGALAASGTDFHSSLGDDNCKDMCLTLKPQFGNLDGVRIPAKLLEHAQGVAVMTVVKGGFGLAGVEFGTGLVVARLEEGWTGPCAIGTAGISWGALIGAQVSDHVFLLMNRDAVKLLFSNDGSVQLGADVGVALGPVGRSVEADFGASLQNMAPIYSYSQSKGLYAGASLDGKLVVTRHNVNEKFYGKKVTGEELLLGQVPTPPAAQPLYDALARCHVYSSNNNNRSNRQFQRTTLEYGVSSNDMQPLSMLDPAENILRPFSGENDQIQSFTTGVPFTTITRLSISTHLEENLDSLPCEVLMNVVSFFNAKDSCRFGSCCRQMYYVSKEYPRLVIGPELGAASSWDPNTRCQSSASSMLKSALEKIRGPPNLALVFCKDETSEQERHTDTLEDWRRNLPPNMALISATAPDIQVDINEAAESSSHVSLMLGSFPSTQFLTFFQQGGTSSSDLFKDLQDATPVEETSSVQSYWKAFIVYCCVPTYAGTDDFVRDLQLRFPDAIIIGGLCNSGHVGFPQESTRQIIEVFEGVSGWFGVAMGGNVPLRSVVSKGLFRISEQHLFVETIAPTSSRAAFGYQNPSHTIASVRNEQGMTVPLSSLGAVIGDGMTFLGVKHLSQDGFQVVSAFEVLDHELNVFGDINQVSSLEGIEIAFFSLNGESCLEDMDNCMQGVIADASREGMDVLGAVMFGCMLRGPTAAYSLLGESMADARLFQRWFPSVLCLGFYAGGEIGPWAHASNNRQHVFRRGEASVQAFTAIFGIFVSPENKDSICSDVMDDSVENVSRFIEARLERSNRK